MKFKSRLNRLEAKQPIAPREPPIFFHSVIEPSDHGPKEVGAFVNLCINGENMVIWRNV